jgi:hypothetical protein
MFLITLKGEACCRRLFEIGWMSQSGAGEVVALGLLELCNRSMYTNGWKELAVYR